MSELRISVDEPGPTLDSDAMESLLLIIKQLVPEQSDCVRYNGSSEVIAFIDTLSESKLSDFGARILELSRTKERSFTIVTSLDNSVREAKIRQYPHLSLSNEHIVHVRPTEESVVHAYLHCMFGAA